MHHLTRRWAALKTSSADSVYVATFLVSRRENWSPEDYLGQAVSGFADGEDVLLAADVTRGSLVSIRLRFIAPDEVVARGWAEAARREVGRMAHFTDALVLRKGRMTPIERKREV